DRGEVRVLGEDSALKAKDRIGYLPEERGVYRKMKVADFLEHMAILKGVPRRDCARRISQWLERVGLPEVAKKKCEELSKGMQQKVQLIGTVLHKPDLLILDEPFSGLDPINQELFRDLLESYRREGKSVVLSTHGMELAERMCDHICLISRGRAVLQGELKQIKREVGGNAYRLVAEGDLERLRQFPEVETMAANNGVVKLMLKPDASGHETLRRMVEFLQVHEFRSEEPELEQIFMKAVRDAA
ncbi:MAG TPA: ATP-binding cassette domain-containing protein, partial [Thermoanaerobaculia bacterium]|nr:ATP-binding cassette domain-containing protein [Thermoanaerobaculia bacterium]